jgi:hypothetical protein
VTIAERPPRTNQFIDCKPSPQHIYHWVSENDTWPAWPISKFPNANEFESKFQYENSVLEWSTNANQCLLSKQTEFRTSTRSFGKTGKYYVQMDPSTPSHPLHLTSIYSPLDLKDKIRIIPPSKTRQFAMKIMNNPQKI